MSTATAERLSISFTDVEGDIDSRKSIALLPYETSVRQIVDALDLSQGDRITKTSKPSKYKDSGQWSLERNEDKTIRIGVDVGCFCSRDCCGHMCGLTYTLGKFGDNVMVVRSTRYNY